MSALRRTLVLLLLLAVAGGAGFWIGTRHTGKDADEGHDAGAANVDEKPLAEVTTAPLRRASISETIVAYGSVVAQPGEVRVVSVPFESRVMKTRAIAGQQLSAGDVVIEVESSPDALGSQAEAKSALAAAQRDLKQTEQRFAEHLATNAELSQAQQTLASAQLKAESLARRGVGTAQSLKADAAGIVGKIDVQEGQIVPAGAPLVEIATGNRIEVSLGVEPSDAAELKPGQPVRLRPVDRPTAPPLEGKIRLIAQRVDPASRLANVLVALPADAHWMLETYVAGEIAKSSAADALVVPRNAVLPEEGGEWVLFTATAGHAVKHTVRIGLTNERDVQVIADDLKEGDSVIILGNYELEDGMAVTTRAAAATTPATNQTPEIVK